jgi:YfiH family protein
VTVSRPGPQIAVAPQVALALPRPFEPDGEHIAIALPGARAVFTTRRGGHSTGPYTSLNLGRWTDDDPAAVEANRAQLARRYNVAFAYARQVHGARVCLAEGPSPAVAPQQLEEADGQATATMGVAPMVLTADCLPIAIAGGGGAAMIHAGWRGLAEGVVPAGVRALRQLGIKAELSAAIGPGAGGCCYEVGEEVHARFAAYDASAGRNLDLKAIARAELRKAGVRTTHDCGLCTICSEPSLFFSHRRDRGVTGRQAGLVWLS